MLSPARKLEAQTPMDERIARLETHVEHLREDVQRVDKKVDALSARVDSLRDSFNEFRLEMKGALAEIARSRLADRVWHLLTSAALLGVMARGFKWI